MSEAAHTPSRSGVQRRGEALRRHIVLTAKDVFLEIGYERTSMDAVAAAAGTSKRSLYAHFGGKDDLFVAVLDVVRELYLSTLGTPGDYAKNSEDAVLRFCGRFQQLMAWESQARCCRLVIAEAERLPESARAYFDAVFVTTAERLADFLEAEYELNNTPAMALATQVLEEAVLPRLMRILLTVDDMIAGEHPPAPARLGEDVALDALREAVDRALCVISDMKNAPAH